MDENHYSWEEIYDLMGVSTRLVNKKITFECTTPQDCVLS
jgi:hypothetical protein